MPVQYDITLAIRYLYESPATAARTLLRMLPLTNARQRLMAGHVSADPDPLLRSDERDFFGNALTAMTFEEAL